MPIENITGLSGAASPSGPGVPLPATPRPTPDSAASGVVVPTQAEPKGLTEASVQAAVDAINRRLELVQTNLKFSVDHDIGKVVVKVVDPQTNEVIRQIPSEVAIAISQSLEKLQGLLVKHEA